MELQTPCQIRTLFARNNADVAVIRKCILYTANMYALTKEIVKIVTSLSNTILEKDIHRRKMKAHKQTDLQNANTKSL